VTLDGSLPSKIVFNLDEPLNLILKPLVSFIKNCSFAISRIGGASFSIREWLNLLASMKNFVGWLHGSYVIVNE